MSDVILGENDLELVADRVQMRNAAGETATFGVQHGNLTLGGDGRDGDLLLLDRAGQVTIALNGESGAVHLGGPGEDGDLVLRDAAFRQTAHIDGARGDVTVTGTVSAARLDTLSDATLKQDIAPIDDAVAALSALKGVTYAFRDRPDDPRAGLLAQDVAQVLPQAVRAGRAGLHVDTAGVVALLVEAVKALSAEVEALKRDKG